MPTKVDEGSGRVARDKNGSEAATAVAAAGGDGVACSVHLSNRMRSH